MMEDRRMESSKNQSLHQNIYWIGNNCLKKSKRMRRQAIDRKYLQKVLVMKDCYPKHTKKPLKT